MVFFYCPPVHTILSSQSIIVGLYIKTIHNCKFSFKIVFHLSYREHGVEENLDKNEIQNIPHDRKTALENIIKNSDNSLIYKNSGNNYVDEKVLQLALDTYSKLESVTDNKKVKIDYSEKKEDK